MSFPPINLPPAPPVIANVGAGNNTVGLYVGLTSAVIASNSFNGANANLACTDPHYQRPTGVFGDGGPNGIGVFGWSGNSDGVQGISTSPAHAGVSAQNNSEKGYGLWAQSNEGGWAIWAQGNVHCTGNHTCKGTLNVFDVLLDAQAGDCAEDFDVAEAEVDAGTVVVINEGGNLQQCGEEYDRKVAGVISGAGGLRPGIILGREEARRPRMPVALVGRAYCKVDASYSPVAIGDLLTTSPTPGHAMRATDPARAFGAVIGKALRPLEGGQGLIPILIALQ